MSELMTENFARLGRLVQDRDIGCLALRGAFEKMSPEGATYLMSLLHEASASQDVAVKLVEDLLREIPFYARSAPAEHLDAMALSAVSYTLGRKTSVPHTTMTWLRRAWCLLEKETREKILTRVTAAIAEDKAGMDFDSRAWAHFVASMQSDEALEPAAQAERLRLIRRAIANLSTAEASFQRIAGPVRTVDEHQPLVVLVHPGDAIEKKIDVKDFDDETATRMLDLSQWSQENMGLELIALQGKVDFVILHRQSSDYQLSSPEEVSSDYLAAIEMIEAEGTVLFGDDLDAAATYLLEKLNAAKRRIIMTGAYAEAESGCIAYLGQALEKAGTLAEVSQFAYVSRDESDEPWWSKGGIFDGL